ncbi:tRNA (guanosine(46)-N7)-methyltransferase TrmB [Leucobacter sp. HY1910]
MTEQQPQTRKQYDPSTFRDKPVSFVRRGGRMTESQDRAWSDDDGQYLLPIEHGPATASLGEGQTGDPVELYGRDAPLTVEVGSGQGHAILHACQQHPDRNFLAVEVFQGGLARTILGAVEAGVTNLKLAEVNAPELLEKYLPAGSVDEVWVFFPDPWHKAKHNKRRLINPDFVAIAHRALHEGGTLRLATDWQEYADQMREVLDAAPEFVRAFEGEWAERYEGRVMTAFERKGLDKGRDIRDLTYTRV